MRTSRKLENIVKGFANHRRVDILFLLYDKPNVSVADIADELDIKFQTAAQHAAKLFLAGLITKRQSGAMVQHRLTPLGNQVLGFLKLL